MAGEEILVTTWNTSLSPEALAGLIALGTAFLVFVMLLAIAVYVYTSLAFVSIAKKTKVMKPGIAWIPVVGPALIASKIAKMHWWPILLLIGAVIPVIGGLFQLVFAVFFLVWLWHTFERLKRPGWWAILCILPVVNLVLIGIAAWGKK